MLSLMSLATGVVRGKVAATWLGPEGVGLVSQLTVVSMLGTTLALAGASTAATIVIGRAHGAGDSLEVERLASFVIVRPLVASVGLCAVIMPFLPQISRLFLGSSSYSLELGIAVSSIPFNVFAATASVVLIATRRAGRSLVANGVSLVIGTIATVSAVVLFDLAGAVAAVLLTSAIAVVVLLVREREWLATALLRRSVAPSRSSASEFYKLGLASFGLAASSSFLDSAQRALLISSEGIADAGLYQAVSMASTQGFAAILNGVMLFLAPALAAMVVTAPADALREWRRTLDITVGVIALVGVVCVLVAPAALQILFSPEFTAATPALRWQVVGEVLRAATFVVGALMLPLGARRVWVAIGLATLAMQGAATWILMPVWGLEALPYAFSLGFAFNLAASLWWAHRRGWHLRSSSLLLLASLPLLLAASVWPWGRDLHLPPLAGVSAVAFTLLYIGYRKGNQGKV